MFCPKCSQQQTSETTRFCSRCGFPLECVSDLIAHDGFPATYDPRAKSLSPRREGVRRGAKVALSGLVLTPVGYAICFFVHNAVPLMLPLTVFLAGLAWMLYSRLFEDPTATPAPPHRPTHLNAHALDAAPSPRSFPAISFGVGAPNTAEVVSPPSVAEPTTKLLDNN